MNAGEFFVEIIVKGGGTAKQVLQDTQKELGTLSLDALEAKAAIVGVLYGLEQMMKGAAERGLSLKQFGDYTGYSTTQLQKWQYALGQSGAEAAEVAGTIKNLQMNMTKMAFGAGPVPGGMALFKTYAGGFDTRQARNPEYVLTKMREFLLNAPKEVGNMVAQMWQIPENVVVGLRNASLDLKKVPAWAVTTPEHIKALKEVAIDWRNLWGQMGRTLDPLTAVHGHAVVKDLAGMTTETQKLVKALTKLGETMGVFEALNGTIKSFSFMIKEITALVKWIEASDFLFGSLKRNQEAEKYASKHGGKMPEGFLDKDPKAQLLKWMLGMTDEEFANPGITKSTSDFVKRLYESKPANPSPAPNVRPGLVPQAAGAGKGRTSFNQTINIEHADPAAVGKEVQRETQIALRQIDAQAQWA